jgi:hypothetical protein
MTAPFGDNTTAIPASAATTTCFTKAFVIDILTGYSNWVEIPADRSDNAACRTIAIYASSSEVTICKFVPFAAALGTSAVAIALGATPPRHGRFLMWIRTDANGGGTWGILVPDEASSGAATSIEAAVTVVRALLEELAHMPCYVSQMDTTLSKLMCSMCLHHGLRAHVNVDAHLSACLLP